MGPSIWHILIVVLVVFLLFGTKRLPNIMEDLAKGMKSFKKGMAEDDTPPQRTALPPEPPPSGQSGKPEA